MGYIALAIICVVRLAVLLIMLIAREYRVLPKQEKPFCFGNEMCMLNSV